VVGVREYGNEVSGSMKDGEFLDHLTVSSSRRTLLHGVAQLV